MTTGRPRRCGWYDAVAARYAAQLNGLDAPDRHQARRALAASSGSGSSPGTGAPTAPPCGIEAIGDPDLQVDIEEHPGWSEDIRDVRRIAELPAAARALLDRIAALTGVPVTAASVGPERSALAV